MLRFCLIKVCILSFYFTEGQSLFFKDSSFNILDTVTVTATRTALPAKLQPFNVNVIRRKELNLYMPRTSPEALMAVPGVFVQKTNHGGGSPFIKGLTGNQVLVLLDGIRVNNATFRYGPNQYLNTIDIFNIDRIEIAKGTGSVQYGSDALGGVLQLFTPLIKFSNDPNWNTSVQTKLLFGSMEQSIRTNIRYSSKNVSVQGGLTRRSFGDLIGGDTTRQQIPSGYDEFGTDLKIGIKLSNQVILTYGFQQLQQTEVPVYHKIVLENFERNHHALQQRNLQYIQIESFLTSDILRKIVFTTSLQESNEIRESRKKNSFLTRKEHDQVSTVGVTVSGDSEKGIWKANSGIEFYADKVKSYRKDYTVTSMKYMRGLYPDDAKSKNISLYSLHQFKLNRVLLHAGVRYSQYFLQMYDSALGNVRIQPNALVVNLAASFQINLTNTLFANLGNGYRAPNIDDLGSLGVVDFRYELPSSSLSPEKSLHTELGYKLVTRKLHLQVSAFRMQLNDMIARVRINKDSINGYPVYRKDNIEKAYVHGAEIQLIYQVKSRLELGLNMTSTFGHNQTKNEPLRRIPPLFGQLFVKYKLAGFELQLTNQAAAKQDRLAQGDKEDNRIPKGGTPGWFISNIFLLKQIRSIQLQAAMYNLGNIDYRIHGSGINGQGRSIGLSLKYAIN